MSADVRKAIESLEKFDVLHEIHEGANAHAFCVNHRHLQERRFLKVIYLPKDEGDSILREPRSLISALEAKPISKNIVRLFDADTIKIESDDYVVLQLEYVEGSSLQTQIETQAIGQQDAVRLTIEILHGVAHLHRQRLVHRDLKPGNIMIHAKTPKIADFGSVARIATDNDFVNASQHSALYVPPEAWESGRYTFSSDLYQVALICYQLINGPLPLDGSAYLTKAVRKHLADNGEDYSTLDAFGKTSAERHSLAELTSKENLLDHVSKPRPYLSPAIRRTIQRATKADLAKRYQSAEAYLNKLTQISTPNWKPVESHYEASDWCNWNWKVYERKKSSGAEFVVERSRSGKYRRVSSAADVTTAFHYVESARA